MATIDSSIAMGYKPVQIQDPLNRMAAMMQIEGGQQSQQLNALKIKEAERDLSENEGIRNYLIKADLNTPEGRSGLRQYGKTGLTYEKLLADQEKSTLERKELGGKISKQEMDRNNQKLRDLSRNPSNANIQAYFEDFVLDNPNEAQKIANAQRTRDYLLSADIPTRNAYLSSLGATASDLKPTVKDRDIGGSIIPTVLDPYSGLPVRTGQPIKKTATPGESMADARARERLAADLDPNIIRSKAENIRLGTLAAEQSPLAPKVIAANAGKDLVGDVATQMGNSYLKLYESSGIKSTTRGAAANLAASSQSSMLGQIGGGILGTENQSERDFIKSQRPILVQGIVKATGMTASQINSNVELKNLLDAATDPDKGYETNAKNLNLINKRFGTGTNIMPEKPTAATQSGVNTVTTSDGKTYTFPTPAAAAQFKQAAGIK
jgi:hypothetical protein